MAQKNDIPFYQKLTLNQYMLSLFGKQSFAELTENIKGRDCEGINADGVTKFLTEISFAHSASLTYEQLLPYDEHIRHHTKAIRGKRQRITWKYFQYIALLFTEIYLDKYSNNPDKLLQELNDFAGNPRPFSRDDLRKIAFWSATGSGKTLIMHINIKQYLHYFKGGRQKDSLNKILLVTPNEGLSKQHKVELDLSGIRADFFSKQTGSLLRDEVQIIEITKLAEQDGEKTVAIDAFEGNNLVLVDEGHRGTSGKEWLKRRRAIAKQGFTFEYSATLGQAVTGNVELETEYSKAILFDYSYRYFYDDGFGKDYQIFNLKTDKDAEAKRFYLLTCLLSFYQQKYLYTKCTAECKKFQIENPLWIFVGSSVNAVRGGKGNETSDVIDILLFLAWFANAQNKSDIIERITAIISGNTGMADETGHDAFENIVPHLSEMPSEEIYQQAMDRVFHSPHGGAFHLEQLKGADGEIALRIGENKIFGVINVGDASKLCKLCAQHDAFNVSDKHFKGSLFHGINNTTSDINILIGSKKFTEGWNSWRVSVMGLMNMGRGEGSEIIQLFGRGVRLKGYLNTLKRHNHLGDYDIQYDKQLAQLERLNIFGIRADYMEAFKKQLEQEGINTDDKVTIILPVIETPNINISKLKIIRIKDGLNYQQNGDALALHYDENVPMVALDYYPKIQSLFSSDITGSQAIISKDESKLQYRELLDDNTIYFDLHAYKYAQGWHNLTINQEAISHILSADKWYQLLMPKQQHDMFDIELWQEIASNLLRKYTEKFYRYHQNKWEAPHRQYVTLDKNNKNFIREYHLTIDNSRNGIIDQLRKIEEALKNGQVPALNKFGQSETIFFDRHLYQPLLYVKDDKITIKPVSLNEGEKQFVEDLQEFCDDTNDKEIYLMRNMSRGSGIGFFEAENFYPDFILWVLKGDKQYINFIDPKGLRNIPADSPKIKFYQKIKKIEKDLGNDNIILNSYIVSVTKKNDLVAKYAQEDLSHILFQNDDKYVTKIFEAMIE